MFNITIDVPEKKLYFERNSNFGEKLYVNCSGIDLQLAADKQQLIIHQVFEDSPASEAGVLVNDELIAINGTAINKIELPDIKKMLRGENEKVTLKIGRNGEEKTVSFTLKSLIED